MQSIDEARNYLTEEIHQNELMSKKHEEICTTLNYIEYLFFLVVTFSQCVFISSFASIVGIPVIIANSAVGLIFFAITIGVE